MRLEREAKSWGLTSRNYKQEVESKPTISTNSLRQAKPPEPTQTVPPTGEQVFTCPQTMGPSPSNHGCINIIISNINFGHDLTLVLKTLGRNGVANSSQWDLQLATPTPITISSSRPSKAWGSFFNTPALPCPHQSHQELSSRGKWNLRPYCHFYCLPPP